MSALGVLLRRHREDAQLTQEELADRAGLSARTISDIERGVRSRAYSDTAARLCDALALVASERATFLETARGRSSRSDTTASRVPRPMTALVGRERELGQLVGAFVDRGSRLVTVTGLGGVGKTRLGLAAAAELEPHFGGRIHVLHIAPNLDPDHLVRELAKAVGSPERASPHELAAHLAGYRTLVLLDTVEHVLAAAPDLGAVLSAAPDLHVLATSRERLRIAGERELPLLPLPVPEPSDPRWSETAAAELFLDRARAARPDLDVDRELVIDICSRVSGVPLALELAAARVRHLPLAALSDRLRTGIGDLVDPGREPPDRHHSMEQTLAWSTASLDESEAVLLQVGALFPGGWRLDAAQHLCGPGVDVVRAVSGLVDKSLVFVDPSSDGAVPRWHMFDVVREFVQGSEPNEETAGRRAALTAFYVDLLAEAGKNVGREREWFGLIATEEANVRAALSWAEDEHDTETLLRLSCGMWQFWQTRGDLTEGRRWLETGLADQPPASDGTRMTALWGHGWLAYHQGDDAAAEASGVELEELARRHGDDAGLRNALTLRGMVAIARADATEAVELLDMALRIARGLESDWIRATSLLNLGVGHLAAGDVPRARAVLGEAVAAYEAIGDERFRARCLGYLGMASLVENDPDRARALFGQSLRVFREVGERGGTAEGLVGLAAVDAATGHLSRAAILAGAAERLRESFAGRELPLDRKTNGGFLASAEASLGTEAWAEEWATGRELPLDEAIELALAEPDR